jgi:cephalosporin hydroxylase
MGNLKEFFKRKVRRHIHTGGDAALNPQCERLEVNNWIVSEFVMYDLVPVVGVHPYPLNELCLMVTAVAALKPTHLFEWGTNLGKSARIFHETSRRFGVGTRIYSVDLPEDIDHVEHPHEKRGMFVKGIDKVTLLLGDGLDTSLKLCRELKVQGTFSPLFFIDGDHSYDSVKRELEAIISAVPEANILLHDTFYQSLESNYNIGPHQAVENVLPVAPQQYSRLTQNLGLPGMTLLYRKQK